MRGNAIFSDGCSCALIGYDNDKRHPYILDFETYVDSQYLDDLGYIWREGRLRLRLSKRVPDIAPKIADVAVKNILKRNNLNVKDISHWVVHAAGLRVLDNIKEALGLSEKNLELSKETLRKYGNVSSATVGIIAKLMMQKAIINSEDYVIMVTIGPGMTGSAVLLKFES